jgi:dihydrodipicolinate synthase/N-acetylneuraminate lyase
VSAASTTRIADGLRGVTAVLVTPYRDGHLDDVSAENIARTVGTSGVHAIAALGNTAEVFQLTIEEQRSYLRAVSRAEIPALRIAGFAGAAKSVLDEIDRAADLGFEIAMLHEPADPFGDSEGLLSYYRYVAARSTLPVVLYLRTERLDVDALHSLAFEPSVVGVKYARADLDTLSVLLNTDAAGACVWVNGAAEMRAAQFLPLGLTGFTSGIANVRPDLSLAVHHALVDQDAAALDAALTLIEPVERLRAAGNGKYNVAVLKELFRAAGTDVGEVRPPHSPLSRVATEELHAAIAAWPEPSALREPPGIRAASA